MRLKLLWMLVIMLFLAVTVAHAQGTRPNISIFQNVSATGGNITFVDLFPEFQTTIWNGFIGRINLVGNISPKNITITGGEINYFDVNVNVTAPETNFPLLISGFIFMSNFSEVPTNLSPGNFSILDDYIEASVENASATFTSFETFEFSFGTVENVPTTYLYINNASRDLNFRQGYVNDLNGSIIMVIEVTTNETGYNNTFFDFQGILPTGSDQTYFLSTDITVTVLGAEGEAEEGKSRTQFYKCLTDWSCSSWGSCIGGVQERECTSPPQCISVGIVPPTVKECSIEDVEIEKKEPAFVRITEELFACVGEPLSTEFTIRNPNGFSMDQVLTQSNIPSLYQGFIGLHDRTPLYNSFGVMPLGSLFKELNWNQEYQERFRLMPREEISKELNFVTPMIKPKTIKSEFEAVSGGENIASKELEINIETKEFVIVEEKDGKNTQIQILVDNRGKPSGKANIELDFNKGRSTLFTELYTVNLPEDDVGIYGHVYRFNFDYDTIKGRYDHFISEENENVCIRGGPACSVRVFADSDYAGDNHCRT